MLLEIEFWPKTKLVSEVWVKVGGKEFADGNPTARSVNGLWLRLVPGDCTNETGF